MLLTCERVIVDTHAPVTARDGLLSKPSLTFTKWLFWIQILCSLLETKAFCKNWKIRNIPSISKRSELWNPYFYQSYIYTSLCLQVHVCINWRVHNFVCFVLFSILVVQTWPKKPFLPCELKPLTSGWFDIQSPFPSTPSYSLDIWASWRVWHDVVLPLPQHRYYSVTVFYPLLSALCSGNSKKEITRCLSSKGIDAVTLSRTKWTFKLWGKTCKSMHHQNTLQPQKNTISSERSVFIQHDFSSVLCK